MRTRLILTAVLDISIGRDAPLRARLVLRVVLVLGSLGKERKSCGMGSHRLWEAPATRV